MIRTILIDDEIASIESLEVIITEICTDIEIIAQTTSPIEGIKLINDLKPDLIFLDISMPKMNGFELLDTFPKRDFKVIFLTAHNEHAIKAFKANAQNYLLKPVFIPDLINAIEQLKSTINLESKESKNASKKSDVIAIPNMDGIEFVVKSEIIRIESRGTYSVIYLTNNKNIVLSKSLNELESMLEDNLFFRVHRSFVINMSHVIKLLNKDGGTIQLSDGAEILISRRKKEEFLSRYK